MRLTALARGQIQGGSHVHRSPLMEEVPSFTPTASLPVHRSFPGNPAVAIG